MVTGTLKLSFKVKGQYMPQNNYNQAPKQPVSPPPLPAKPKYQFRWALVGVPLVVIVFIWIANNIRPSFEFDGITELLQIKHTDNFTRFVALMILGLALIVIVKLFRKRPGP